MLEICIDSLESAKNAIEGGADRLEVCSALSVGGLTPSGGLIVEIRKLNRTIPLYAMIRIRSGNFVYSDEELKAMMYDMEILRKCKVDGFVFGALTDKNNIDINACEKIISAALPLPVTFHRAFDLTNDPIQSMNTIAHLGFQRILTSGQENNVLLGLEQIKELLKAAPGNLIIMPGGGITKDNIETIKNSGAREFHASARKEKIMMTSAKKIGMGICEEFVSVTNRKLVEELVFIINKR